MSNPDLDPKIHIDELPLSFVILKGEHDHQSIPWRHVTEDLGCTLKALTRAAMECCKTDEAQFLQVLNTLLKECPERLITIDETHKYRSASIKRRGWSKRNCKVVIMREWFQNFSVTILLMWLTLQVLFLQHVTLF